MIATSVSLTFDAIVVLASRSRISLAFEGMILRSRVLVLRIAVKCAGESVTFIKPQVFDVSCHSM